MTGVSRLDRDGRRLRDDRHRGAPPSGARELSAILPNGRTLWLRVQQPLAPVASVSHLARTAENSAGRRGEHSAIQSEAIDRLARSVAADSRRVEAARLSRAAALRRRMLAAHAALDERLSKARDELRARLDKQLEIDRENIRRLRRRTLWDDILVASSLPLFAAYGERDSPFGSGNLALTLLLLVFLLGDEVVEALIGSGENSKSPYAVGDADAWTYLAPFANVLAGWWLLSGRQRERFVSGVTTVKLEKRSRLHPNVFHAGVELKDRVGQDHYPDFETFKDAPVVATVGQAHLLAEHGVPVCRVGGVSAKVRNGRLRLSVSVVLDGPRPAIPSLGTVDVAWIVDTREPRPATSGS